MIIRPNAIDAIRLNPRTGLPEVNPLRDVTRSWAQGTQRNVRQSIAASATADDTIEVAAERGLTGDFEVTHFTTDQSAAYRVELYVSGGTDKRLTSVPIHVDLLCGTAQFPFYAPSSLFLEARNNLNIKFTNISANITNQIRFVAHGRRFLDYEAAISKKELIRQFYGRNEHPYWLGLDDTTVALTASQTGVRRLMSVPGDADFEAEYLVAKSTGPFRIMIREGSGNSRPIISASGATTGVPNSHICGTALAPYRFSPDTAYFKRLTKIEVTLDDLSAAANTVELALVGRLLYYPESTDRPQAVSSGTPMERAIQEQVRAIQARVSVPVPAPVNPRAGRPWWA